MSIWYALVDLLPFQWAEPGSMLFMKNALLAVLIISPLFGLLSTMVVENHMAFFSDALGHSAFTGIAIGTLCGFIDATWCAVILAVVFALLFTWVQQKTKLASDTIIGVFASTAIALGIFVSTLNGHSFTKFNSLLIGDILSVSPGKIAILAVILLLVLILWAARLNQLALTAVYPILADSRGIRTGLLEALFNCAIAIVVTLSLSWVGLLVINSLLVLPGSRRQKHRAKYETVHALHPTRRHGLRHRRSADLFLRRHFYRCLHHALSGPFLRPHLLSS